MNTSIATIYENGVLRPLVPLSLPERSQVWVRIVAPEKPDNEVENARQALIRAGLVLPRQTQTRPAGLLTDEQRAALAKKVQAAGPLSDLIIEERRTGP